MNKINLPELIGKGYRDYWFFKGRFRICKGSRASKKSKTTALNFIYRIMKYKDSNLLVIRKNFSTLKQSCFSELRWAIRQLNVTNLWYENLSSLELTFIPTGQKIIFRGLDNPLKITSISIDKGFLCWIWIEEGYEIFDEQHFDILQESIRGRVPSHLFKQITITFNPWSENHWLKKRFFDVPKDDDILAITTNYKCNEWLDNSDLKMFEEMKKNNPIRYNVAGLGNWGICEGLIYENFLSYEFDFNQILQRENANLIFGLDFGYTNDPTALFCGIIDTQTREIYVFDELYKKSLTNYDIYNQILEMGYHKNIIFADSAEPKSIQELRQLGIYNIRPAKKGKDSINNGIQFIQGFKIIIHPRCKNFLIEISNYSWAKDKFGKYINKPIDDFNHLLDAMRYALSGISNSQLFSFD